jgi:endonuclease-3
VKRIPSNLIPLAHHWLILHGRYVCIARKPKCAECGISKWCRYFEKITRAELVNKSKAAK